MPKKFSQRAEDLRRALAQEAARIMAEHGIGDFLQAKRKAADRLGVNDVAVLPKNIEIEAALREHQRLFGRDSHDHTLKEQRRIALDTMRMLNEFQPRLVGSVLTGTATNYSDINLHLFADRSESVAMRLLEIGVPHEFYERRVKMDAETEELVVISSPFFPHKLANGYSNPAGSVVYSVNGTHVRSLKHLVALLRDLKDPFVTIEFDQKGNEALVFSRPAMLAATDEVLTDNGVRAQGSPNMMTVWQEKAGR